MAYIYQAATSIADTAKLSLSFFFRIPASSGLAATAVSDLLAFGLYGEDDVGKANTLTLLHNTTLGIWQLEFRAHGGGPNANPDPPPPYFAMQNRWLSANMTNVGTTSLDTWHHLAFGYDGSNGIVGDGFHALSGSPVFNVVLDRSTLTGTSSATDPIINVFNIDRGSSGMYVNGLQLGVPTTKFRQESGFFDNQKIDMAYYQVWFNQYIDWTDSTKLNKVITTDGHPADTTGDLALAAFGPRSFFFKGGAAAFSVNLGSGGAMTKVGTLTDFTPGP